MEDEARLTRQLGRLGLTTYEAKAYLALIRRDSFTAAQVARQSGLPRQRIYDVLGSLVEKGLASARPGSVVKYAAIAPEMAVTRLVQTHRQELADLETQAIGMIQQLTPAFAAGQEHTDPLEYIEVLRDRRAINERFAELQAGVKREILVFTKPPYATPPADNLEGLEVTRSHQARSMYEFSVLRDAEAMRGIERFIDAGEEARFAAELPLKLVIIDESVVMFGMQDPVANSSDLTIVVIEHPSLGQLLKIAFEAVWANGLTIDAARNLVFEREAQPA